MKGREKRKQKNNRYALLYDFIIIAASIVAAILLSKVGVIDAVVYGLRDYSAFACFAAGLFFTSTFTIAPASVAIIHLAKTVPLPFLAFWGALGAVVGDLILFFFIRDRFVTDIMNQLKPSTMKHIIHSFHFGFLKWIAPILGLLIIASPLPDEFGLSLLGMSKVKVYILIPVTFIMNIIAVYAIVGFANLIS